MNLSESLLEWYYVNQRSLPWRETTDPYAIWLSEVMLQQTQVDTVIDYYKRFLNSLPTVKDLANAPEDQVYKLWEGLGYYSRAKNLMSCAKEISEQHNGQFPNTYEEIISLPGIGPYTAGAVLSIAFNLPYPAVDGNVMRVISRIFRITEDISLPKTRHLFEEKVMDILPEDRRHFNQALMELGATVCTPKNPKCDICPVKKLCQANLNKIWHELPVKIKRTKKTLKKIGVAYITYNNKIFILKKTDKGLLNGLWGFPYVEYSDQQNPISLIAQMTYKEYGLIIDHLNTVKKAKHIFTHIVWDITLYQFELYNEEGYSQNKKETIDDALNYDKLNEGKIDYLLNENTILEDSKTKWVTIDELKSYPFSTAFKKLLTN